MELRSRKKVKTAHQNGSGEYHDQDSAPSSAAKTQTMGVDNSSEKIVRRRRGTLQILEWPLDLILELCKALHPRDLLSLSQTSKGFRRKILDRNNMSSIWAAALSNAPDLPPRVPSMSIPAFVRLLFTPYCHVCGVAVVEQVIWAWQIRCCTQCLPTVSYSWTKTRQLITSINSAGTVAPNELHEQFPAHVIQPHIAPMGSSWKSAYKFSKAMVDAYVAELKKISRQGRVKGETEIPQLCRERVSQTRALVPYIQQYERWDKQQAVHRREQRFEEYALRLHRITRRLRAAGWSKELEFLGTEGLKEMSERPTIRRTSKLTQGEWVAIKDSLEDHLNKTRVQRTRVERFYALQDAVVAHYVTLPRNATMDCRPKYIEFAVAGECRALVEAPVSQPITREDFMKVIPRLVTNWQEEKAAMLRQRLRSEIWLGKRSKVDPLDLAIATWVCGHCRMPLRYPAVLAHSCAYPPLFGSDHFTKNYEHLIAAVYRNAGPKPRATPGRLPSHLEWMVSGHKEQVLNNMVAIVSAMGLKPKSATIKDLEEYDARVRCVRCRQDGLDHEAVYGWEAALEHARKCVREGWPAWDRWERVEESKMPAVREREAIEHNFSFDQYPQMVVWVCALCVNWDGRRDEARTHLKDVHGLDDPKECVRDGTIYVHPTASVGALLKPAVTLPLTRAPQDSSTA
ncbi:hypothetical protein C8Q74DRAFT_1215236 [Fomes fomentarius]|nr:hypothetical protein C8Q74DRAFT_1215236 [Fomes fomentarius]